MKRSLIFDIGANRGQNLEYFLLKAKKVVAVEANPVLAEEIRQQFKNEISNGSLVVMDVVLTDGKREGQVDFFVHRSNHVLSTFVPPTDQENYARIKLPSMSVAELVAAFGCADYLKIDVEQYDHIIASAFFDIGCFPSEISIEAHTRKSMDVLLKAQNYRAFKVVDGSRVAKDYHSHHISVNDNARLFDFPHHSAGPFGEDLRGTWIGPESLAREMKLLGFGWKDIHASSVECGVEREKVRHTCSLLLKVLYRRAIRGALHIPVRSLRRMSRLKSGFSTRSRR